MSQRNPLNERYTTEEKLGKTRKSAASAKPVTKAASSVRTQSSKQPQQKGIFGQAKSQADKAQGGKKSRKQREREERARLYSPDTPEYNKWRRIWWVLIGAALVLTMGSFVFMYGRFGVMNYVILGLGYVCLAGAIGVDVIKVRKIRNEYAAGLGSDRSKAATAARKAQKAQERQAAQAAQRIAEQPQSRESGKRFALPFGRRKDSGMSKADTASADAPGETTD